MVKNPSVEASNVGYFTSLAEDFNSGSTARTNPASG